MLLITILFILANIVSFGIFAISIARFKKHRSRYPLPENRSAMLFKCLRSEVVIIASLILLILISVLFAYLLFWEKISITT